ncbi:GNAT family N-acetyltransferase [Paeniglutamicibacter antarcticus]|uniref:GNAT family N-acetyltransferase n=1 Tax=Arthrobacter terrae TaxID=2935737 RepID=A0A931G8Q1_9MICC|nr:GNAT family N-acetyltransferase [Arthrobacter terrae]MBG0740429.1 GNAT family N-acetyltransferase [Arthrobacter terrae]
MFRPSISADLGTILTFAAAGPVGWIDAGRYRRELATNNYRDHWTWIAEVNGVPIARAIWWAPSGANHPAALDCLLVKPSVREPEELAAGLLKAAHVAFKAAGATVLPDYTIDVAVGWHEDPRAREAVAWRRGAAQSAGLKSFIERVNFEWTPGNVLPVPAHELDYRSGTDQEFKDAFARAAEGSLDAQTKRNLAVMGPDGQAQDDLDFYLCLPGDRAAWRLAFLPSGAPLGFIIPTRTAYDASVSYLGVYPGQRGRGYIHELLGEITRVHAASGAPRIVGTTDLANAPMLAAFERAGYRIIKRRLVLTA